MTVVGDRQSASLLSALAEAPDSAAASAFLVAQLAELSGARRVSMLRVDGAQEALICVAAIDSGRPVSASALQLSDLNNPLVVSTLSLSPVTGKGALRDPFGDYAQWTSLPMTQPRTRMAPPVMIRQQAMELLASQGLTPIARPERPGT